MATPQNTNDATNKSHAKKPDSFTGGRKQVIKFLYETDLYILANNKDFTDDKSKIIFTLSYMAEGEADKWKEHWLRKNVQNDGSLGIPGTYKTFVEEIQAAFAFEDKVKDSIRKLKSI